MSRIEVIKYVLKFILKYIVPIIAGWLEGDTHFIQDALL